MTKCHACMNYWRDNQAAERAGRLGSKRKAWGGHKYGAGNPPPPPLPPLTTPLPLCMYSVLQKFRNCVLRVIYTSPVINDHLRVGHYGN